MKISVIENPTLEQVDFFEKRIEEFNVARWEIKKKFPLVVEITNEDGKVIGGAAGKTFGLWLIIDNLWLDESLRGQRYGTQVLQQMEKSGSARGCKYALLETLNFQARPFYEKHGYQLQWTQDSYPRDGKKYFLTKNL